MKGVKQRRAGRRRRRRTPEPTPAPTPTPETEPVDAKIKRLLFEQHADTVLLSVTTPEDVEKYIKIGKALNDESITEKEKEQLALIDAEMMASCCGMCGMCSGCPRSVDIAAIQRYMMYHESYGYIEEAKFKYRRLGAQKTILNCSDCGTCEQVCPRHLPVRNILKEAHSVLS